MQDDDDDGGGDDSKSGPISAASVAKWFIPSAVALFAIVGYIVQTAQEALLGIGSISHVSTSYTEATALFVRDLISLPLDVMFGSPLSLFVHWPTLCAIVGASVLLIASRRMRGVPAVLARRAPVFIAGGLLIVKLLAYDVPLSLVNNVIFGGETDVPTLFDRGGPAGSDKANGWIRNRFLDRANRFAHAIVCSHLSKGELASHPELSGDNSGVGSGDCDPSQADARDSTSATVSTTGPRAAFTVLVLLQIVIAAASIIALRRRRASRISMAIGLLGLICGLTLPYDYGKLLKSTSFEWAHVKLSLPLRGEDGVNTECDGTMDGKNCAENGKDDADKKNQIDSIDGLLMAYDSSETRLLYTYRSKIGCGKSGGKKIVIRMLSLPPTAVVAVTKIQSRDIFDWSYENYCY